MQLDSLGEISPHALAIGAEAVAKLARCEPIGRWRGATEDAITRARSLVDPLWRFVSVSDSQLDSFFRIETPVESVVREHPRWAFAVTIGPRIEARVRELTSSGEYLEAVLTDAVGSVAVEALLQVVQVHLTQGAAAVRFSPGYCHWSLADQSVLLEMLNVDTCSLRLLPSNLIEPLKTVTGFIVQGDPGRTRVPPGTCGSCQLASCDRRQQITRMDPGFLGRSET